MQKKKILVLLAVKEELGEENFARLSRKYELRLMGVGKLRAFEATMRALSERQWDVVINLGTCGSSKHPYATILRPGVVVQGDIYLDSIFATKPLAIATGCEGVRILSSDNFIGEDTPEQVRSRIAEFDCMDMESYAMLRAIGFYSSLTGKAHPEVYMIKIVSDGADSTVGDWSERIKPLQPKLCEQLEELINQIEYDN